jgi:hypothetical protein
MKDDALQRTRELKMKSEWRECGLGGKRQSGLEDVKWHKTFEQIHQFCDCAGTEREKMS